MKRKTYNLTSDSHFSPLKLCAMKFKTPLARTDTSVYRDINNIVMDYLITEGYPLAARSLAVEANMQPKTDFESIHERVEIRDSIHKGDLQTAIEKINELNPQV